MFTEIKRFQVKPDKVAEFESRIPGLEAAMEEMPGCISVSHMKRFYTIDGVEPGQPPRELTRVVKCVQYYSVWVFTDKESYGVAIARYFELWYKELAKLLIAPFDIQCGYKL